MMIELAINEQTVEEVVFRETEKNCVKQLRYCKAFVSDEHSEVTDVVSDEKMRGAAKKRATF